MEAWEQVWGLDKHNTSLSRFGAHAWGAGRQRRPKARLQGWVCVAGQGCWSSSRQQDTIWPSMHPGSQRGSTELLAVVTSCQGTRGHWQLWQCREPGSGKKEDQGKPRGARAVSTPVGSRNLGSSTKWPTAALLWSCLPPAGPLCPSCPVNETAPQEALVLLHHILPLGFPALIHLTIPPALHWCIFPFLLLQHNCKSRMLRASGISLPLASCRPQLSVDSWHCHPKCGSTAFLPSSDGTLRELNLEVVALNCQGRNSISLLASSPGCLSAAALWKRNYIGEQSRCEFTLSG
jgi:hypothetical protein